MVPPPLADFPSTPNLGVANQPRTKCRYPPLEPAIQAGPEQGTGTIPGACGEPCGSRLLVQSLKMHTMFPWQSCLLPLSQLQREVKVLPRNSPNQSPSNFWACSLNPATIAILPLCCSHLPISCLFPCATFYGFARKERRFFFPLFASLHYSHLFIQALSPFVFQSWVDLGFLFPLWDALVDQAGVGRRSGSQASTRGGGNVPLQINQNFLLQKC